MLSVSSSICLTTITATRIPFSLLLSSLSLTHFCSATTKRTVSRFHSQHFCFKTPPPPPPMPPSSSSKIIAEYAKSGRSSCKTCSNPIPAKALRLGSVSRDSRGFDMAKWYHLDCFSHAIESTEIIGGFDSLQSCDQEALRKLVDSGFRSAVEGVEDAVEGTRKRSSKIQQADEDRQETEQGELCSKKTKMSVATKGSELSVAFSTSDIKDNFKDATLLPKWKALQTIIFLERDDGLLDSNKIAAFDFDGCLAKTSVKRIGADAWSLMYPSIPDKLQSLYNDGYKLVIFTNESNIDRWKNKRQVAVDSKLGRLNNFIDRVKVPIQVFVACGYDGKVEDPFRKPKPGMWLIMEKHFNSGIPIDMDQSFYVGDAAGRASDHSDADIKFAEAVRLKFHLPEDYFGA